MTYNKDTAARLVAEGRALAINPMDIRHEMAEMLEAAGAEVERWENCAICIECGRAAFDEDGCCTSCGRDVLGFVDGKLVTPHIANHFDGIERRLAHLARISLTPEEVEALVYISAAVESANGRLVKIVADDPIVAFHSDRCKTAAAVIAKLLAAAEERK